MNALLDDRFSVPLRGIDVDAETRCTHWNDTVDIVAFRFACCGVYYPCYQCHADTADHEATPWPKHRFDESSVLCGACRTALTAHAYLACDDVCPSCGARFNPGCRAHRHRYFEL